MSLVIRQLVALFLINLLKIADNNVASSSYYYSLQTNNNNNRNNPNGILLRNFLQNIYDDFQSKERDKNLRIIFPKRGESFKNTNNNKSDEFNFEIKKRFLKTLIESELILILNSPDSQLADDALIINVGLKSANKLLHTYNGTAKRSPGLKKHTNYYKMDVTEPIKTKCKHTHCRIAIWRPSLAKKFQSALVIKYHEKPKKNSFKINYENLNQKSIQTYESKNGPTKRNVKRSAVPQCQLRNWNISTRAIPWGHRVIMPTELPLNVCRGTCLAPIGGRASISTTNNAIIRSLVRAVRGHARWANDDEVNDDSPPPAHCVPTNLKPLSIMYQDGDYIIIKIFEDMVVDQCGCR